MLVVAAVYRFARTLRALLVAPRRTLLALRLQLELAECAPREGRDAVLVEGAEHEGLELPLLLLSRLLGLSLGLQRILHRKQKTAARRSRLGALQPLQPLHAQKFSFLELLFPLLVEYALFFCLSSSLIEHFLYLLSNALRLRFAEFLSLRDVESLVDNANLKVELI